MDREPTLAEIAEIIRTRIEACLAATPGWVAMSGQTISKAAKQPAQQATETTVGQATTLTPRQHLVLVVVWRILSQDSRLNLDEIKLLANADPSTKGGISKDEVSAAMDELRRRRHLRGYGYNKVVATPFRVEVAEEGEDA